MLKALEQPDHRNRKQKGEDVNFEHIIKSNSLWLWLWLWFKVRNRILDLKHN